MGLRKLGDSAWIFKSGLSDTQQSLQLILQLLRVLQKEQIPEVVDIVSSYDTIAVHFNPSDGDTVFKKLAALTLEVEPEDSSRASRTLTIPVAYGGDHGPDLKAVASHCKLSDKKLVQRHTETEYTVAAIGFSPGFPYLSGLPEELHQSRHASPRKVAAGSVAIGGGQTGVYPNASQAGWQVIGRTDAELFNPQRKDPSLLRPGDLVRFDAVDELEFSEPHAQPEEDPVGSIRVLNPGPLTSIQDHGRYGHQHIGVSPGGAADPILATIANRLVGNPDDAAVLECTMSGPKLQFDTDSRIAWIGWSTPSGGKPIELEAGARIDLTNRTTHLRGYIAVAGGIDVPLIMGSRSTDIRAGFGGYRGRTLRTGDLLPVGTASNGPSAGSWHVAWPKPNGYLIELRFTRGMQASWFSDDAHRMFSNTFYQISPASDRMGTRLQGGKITLKEPQDMISQPVAYGSVQVPPDGQPIILMSERQTIGGYPQIGHVISADLPALARAWPGTQIHFREVTLEEAREAWFDLQRELGLLRTGLDILT